MDIELKNFDQLTRVLSPKRVERDLSRHVRSANQRLGTLLVDKVRRDIRNRKYAPNKPSTIIKKGSALPLVDHGDLLGSASYTLYGAWSFEVGVVKKKDGTNVAKILHDGTILIPARPYLHKSIFSRVGLALINKEWMSAIKKTFKGIR